MSRPDLLALGPQELASLANVGLVKRAQRELDEGKAPRLVEEEDGTVVGTFADGVVARLPPRTPLKQAPCTCGATGVCRHRIGVALAYKPWHAAAHEGETPPSARLPTDWSPGELDDATLEQALGKKLLDRARAVLAKGVLATVERGAVPAAKLPSCTVRFLVPRDVAYARCDCALAGSGCEHLALAVWAFRAAKSGASGASEVVSLGGTDRGGGRAEDALDLALELGRELVLAGVAEASVPTARFAELRVRLDRERMTWLRGLAVDLEIALEGYQKRSALHGTREIAALVIELAARIRAGRAAAHELPARFVLGEDEAPETRLDHVRLVSLGARVRADGRARFADVYLADPDAGVVLVLGKRWDFADDQTPEEGPGLARRPLAPKVRLDAVAHGQVVSKVVTRRANRSIELGSSRAAQTSVTPQRGDWEGLPRPILVRDLAVHAELVKSRPPRVLRPRVLAEEVHVVEVGEVASVAYSAAEQQLVAVLHDASGNPLTLVQRHRRVAPHAIDATAAALSSRVRFVSGDLEHGPRGFRIEPLAIASDRLVVPDLAGDTSAPAVAPGTLATPRDPIVAALTRAEAALEELCHAGLAARTRAALDRLAQAARALDDAGLMALAARLRALDAATRAGERGAADAWLDAGIRLALIREAAAG